MSIVADELPVELTTPEGGTVIPMPIDTEVKRAFIDYSMSVITDRALPDVRDGLKPVHRRILYSMEEKGLRYSNPTKKCAKIVGDVLGSYHPHGDASVYDALVRLAQDFSLRYPVIFPQGNFGTPAGDPPAAYRYTEAKLSRLAEEMVADINKETVDFMPNYDETAREPTVLPGKFPFLLCNGSSGIAVGMATNIPPHNLREISRAIAAYVDNSDVTIDELCRIVTGPDFPTGGIIYGRKGIRDAYRSGKGRIMVRGRFVIEVDKKERTAIVFTEVPYQVNTTKLVDRIKELVRDKVIDGIFGCNDETSDRVGGRIVIDLKRGAIPKVILNQLFSHTELQQSFSVNNMALVGGRPLILTLKDMVELFVKHRQDVITRRTRFELRKAEERSHILEALVIATQNIDEVIKIIRASANTESAKTALTARFGFDDSQSQAIVDMQLKRLTSLEIANLRKELAELAALITHLKDLIAHPEKILALVKDETKDLAEKYGDERKTDIVADEVEQINIDDLIQEEEMVILISKLGYVRRVPVAAYRNQGRGGKGSSSAKLVDDDFINRVFTASTHDVLTFITNEGKAYWLKAHEIPESGKTTRGTHLNGLLGFSPNEEVTAVVALKDFSDSQFLFMSTKKGVVKKVATSEFKNAKTRGIIAIHLDDGDELVSGVLTGGNDEVVLVTRGGQALRITETDVRAMGRSGRGVAGIKLSGTDELAGAVRVSKDNKILLVCERGYGKRVEFGEFTTHGRATGGQKIYATSDKTGEIVGMITLADNDEAVCVTSQGKSLRVNADAIACQGRTAGGVKVLDIEAPDTVVGLDRVVPDDE